MTARLRRWSAAGTCGLITALAAAPPAAADEFRDKQWHLGFLHVAQAHQISAGDGVTVAVIDTGVQANQPDLVGNVLPGVDLTGADTKGQQDTDGHGTAMVGLIAAHGHGPGNADGALGIAPHAKILPIRVPKQDPAGVDSVAVAIDDAVQGGAEVISISLSGGIDEQLQHSVQSALAAGVVIVAGAGNRPGDAFVTSPARIPGVVAVGAIGRDGNLAPISVTGKEVVLTAPGVDIVSTCAPAGYCTGTGTSDATAIVAGAAALVRSKYPNLPATEVVHRLTATATDKGAPGRDPEYGYGVLNLVAALTADVKPAPAASNSTGPDNPTGAPSQPAAGPTITATGSVRLKLNPMLFVCLGVVALIVLAGVGVLSWLLTRNRTKAAVGLPYPPPGYNPQPGQGPPHASYPGPPPPQPPAPGPTPPDSPPPPD